jgi:aldehyde:ferredoxin oxidoreductase
VLNEKIGSGPSKGLVCTSESLGYMLDRYYELRGWDSDGIPKPEILRKLHMKNKREVSKSIS